MERIKKAIWSFRTTLLLLLILSGTAFGSWQGGGGWDVFSTSAKLASLLSDETGTGSVVFSASPTFTGTVNGAAAVYSGTLNGLVNVTSTTAATLAMTAAQCAGDVHVNGDADAIDYTLPGAAAGLNCCFYALANANVITVDMTDGTDTLTLDGTALTAGNAVDSAGGAGDFLCVFAVDATNWHTLGRSGTWVDGGTD